MPLSPPSPKTQRPVLRMLPLPTLRGERVHPNLEAFESGAAPSTLSACLNADRRSSGSRSSRSRGADSWGADSWGADSWGECLVVRGLGHSPATVGAVLEVEGDAPIHPHETYLLTAVPLAMNPSEALAGVHGGVWVTGEIALRRQKFVVVPRVVEAWQTRAKRVVSCSNYADAARTLSAFCFSPLGSGASTELASKRVHERDAGAFRFSSVEIERLQTSATAVTQKTGWNGREALFFWSSRDTMLTLDMVLLDEGEGVPVAIRAPMAFTFETRTKHLRLVP